MSELESLFASLLQAATPGPWLTGPWSDDQQDHVVIYDGRGKDLFLSCGGIVSQEVANIALASRSRAMAEMLVEVESQLRAWNESQYDHDNMDALADLTHRVSAFVKGES